MELDELEQRVLRMAARLHRLPEELLRQIETIRVERRERTGFGFFSHVTVDPTLAATTARSVISLWASHPDVADGQSGTITFNIFLENGLITLLEGACIEAWPETEERICIEE